MTALENVMAGHHIRSRANPFSILLQTKHAKEEERLITERAYELLKYVGIERFAFLFKAGDEVLGFTVAGFLQLLEADARRAHESFERLGRLAFRVDAASHGRTFLLDDAIGLLRGDLADQQGQTTRRGIGRAEAVGRCEGLFFERGKNAVGKGLGKRLERFWREFFRMEFNQ